jgi:hypothetical protein
VLFRSQLTIGSITAGQYLTRSGSTIVGAAGSGVANAAGSTGNVQYNAGSGVMGGATNANIDASGNLTVSEYSSTTPSAPSSGSTLFSLYRGGYNELVSIGRRGAVQRFAPNPIGSPMLWIAQGIGGTTVDNVGIGAPLALGTAAGVNIATTDFLTQQRRVRYTSATATGNGAGWRTNNTQHFFYSTTTGLGGWRWQVKFIIHTNRSNMRAICGMVASTSSTLLASDPSAATDVAAFGLDAGQTNWRWMVNDSSGTATSTDLGSTYSTNNNDTYLYVLSGYSPPAGGAVYYAAERYDTSGSLSFTDGSSSSNLPTAGTVLSFFCFLAVGTTTGSGVSVEMISAAFSTEY